MTQAKTMQPEFFRSDEWHFTSLWRWWLALIAAAFISTGINGSGKSTESLPCKDLTSYQYAQVSFNRHQAIISELESIGKSVTVNVRHA